MFHLVNPFGNVHKFVKSEAKKDEMLKEGWKQAEEAEPEQAEEKGKPGKKGKKAKEE